MVAGAGEGAEPEMGAVSAWTSAPAKPVVPRAMPACKAALYLLAAVMFSLTQGLGMNLAFANLTQIQGSIAATTTEAAWLSAAYMAPNVSLAIGLIKIRMQYGLRNFAEISLLLFLLASLLNLFVSDLQSAIVVRFLSGIAAAPLSTLAFLYVMEIFPPERKMTVGVSLAMMNTLLAAPVTRLVSPTLLGFGEWQGLYTMEMALALMVLPIIYLLPLTHPPRVKVIVFGDFTSYLFIAIGFGCLAVGLSVGRLYWWFEAPWLGVVLAVGVASLAIAIIRELRRPTPLIDVRWLLSPRNLHLGAILLIFRLIAAEQTSVVMTYYQSVAGLLYEQMIMLYVIVLVFTVVGGLVCAALMSWGLTWQIHVPALAMMATAAFMDSQLTNLTRPEQMYLSQALMAAGIAMFLPPPMSQGFKAAQAKGPAYMVTFFVIFLFTQSIGGLIGSAFFGTLITIREKFHSSVLVERVLLINPDVVHRVSQLSAAYAKVINDQTLLNAEGLALLSADVSKEANILAYGDAFFVAGVMALVALGGLLLHAIARAIRARVHPADLPLISNT